MELSQRWQVWRWVLVVTVLAFTVMGLTYVDAGAQVTDGVTATEAGDPVAQADMPIEYWELITGFGLPLVLSAIIQSGWSRAQQAWTAFGVSLGVTLVQLAIYGELTNLTDPVASILKVLALSLTFYTGFWRPTGVSPAIENATNLNRGSPTATL